MAQENSRPRAAWIETVDDGEAEGALAELYARTRDPVSGRVDHVLRVHGLHPAGLDAHFRLYRACMRPSAGLSGAERELIAFAVSLENACHY